MPKAELQKPRVGTRQITVALESDTEFESIVKALRETLVVPRLPGVRGCAPCLSGLDRLVVQSSILPTG
jgi:hypothetical protein